MRILLCSGRTRRVLASEQCKVLPMITGNGNLLGIVSTHFANVHAPTPIEMQTLQRYGRVAAEYGFMLLDESYASLAAKAEQMSSELYARTLALRSSAEPSSNW